MSKHLHYLLFLSLAIVVVHCGKPDPHQPFQTLIYRVEIEPNPVNVGDTARFTCIIKDSLDERFQFGWDFDRSSNQDTTTQTNFVKWKAPDTTGVFNHGVDAFNNAPDSVPIRRSFNVSVVEN